MSNYRNSTYKKYKLNRKKILEDSHRKFCFILTIVRICIHVHKKTQLFKSGSCGRDIGLPPIPSGDFARFTI